LQPVGTLHRHPLRSARIWKGHARAAHRPAAGGPAGGSSTCVPAIVV
jgi:hypothetical protein